MKAELHFAGREYLGARSDQEDFHGLLQCRGPDGEPDGLLLVLADGMGGQTAGAVASATAVDAFHRAFTDTAGSVPDRLDTALHAANDGLAQAIRQTPALGGMGCTLIGAYITDLALHWVSVGDSMLYVLRGNTLERLNADHSMAPVLAEAVERGEMSRSEATTHPDRSALRSALMGDRLSLIDLPRQPYPLLADDVILVASDGLLSLSTQEIVSVIGNRMRSAAEMADLLIKRVAARNLPGQDNTTLIVHHPSARTQAAAPPPPLPLPPPPKAATGRQKAIIAAMFAFGLLVAAAGGWFLPGVVENYTFTRIDNTQPQPPASEGTPQTAPASPAPSGIASPPEQPAGPPSTATPVPEGTTAAPQPSPGNTTAPPSEKPAEKTTPAPDDKGKQKKADEKPKSSANTPGEKAVKTPAEKPPQGSTQ